MERPTEMILALLSASACILLFLFQRYDPLKGWTLLKFMSWSMGWSAAVHMSRAFDPLHVMSLWSHIINGAGFVIVLLMLIRWMRVAKQANITAKRQP